MRWCPTVLALLMTTALAAAPASRPAPPATRPATGDLVSLGNDLVRFYAPPPDDWVLRATKPVSPNRVYFQAADKKSAVQVELASADFTIDAQSVGPMAAAIVKSLKEKRDKDGTEMVLAPKVEHDRRFDIIVHERFKLGDNTIDELHLYKSVGPRTVMAEASTVLEDPDAAAAVFAAAKTSVASAKWNKKPGSTPPKR
jgi:hypothetical protein